VESDNPAVQFNVQSARVDSKLDYILALHLVRQLLNATRIKHVTPLFKLFRTNGCQSDHERNSGLNTQFVVDRVQMTFDGAFCDI